jgi:hypothetical protein
MRKTLVFAFSALMFFVLISSPAVASTPDGVTPSRETVCDGFSGAAFGLCNSYCEAMDCHLAEPKASRRACDQVQKNFEKKTGQPLPCEAMACPCLALQGFNDLVEGNNPVLFCSGDYELYSATFVTASEQSIFIGQDNEGTPICSVQEETILLSNDEFESCRALLFNATQQQGIFCTNA